MKREFTKRGCLGLLVGLLALLFIVLVSSQPSRADNGYPPPSTPRPTALPGSQPYHVYLPLVLKNFPPLPSPSYYVTNLSTLYDLAHQLGAQDYSLPGAQDRLVILDFRYPRQSGGIFGAQLPFDPNRVFYSTSQIAAAVQQFAYGYYVGTASDTASHVRIVVGTNNCCHGDPLSLFQGHGTAWGQMMNVISQTLISTNASRQVDVVAGSDMEQNFTGAPTDTIDPYATSQWVTNFATASTQCTPDTGGANGCLYNFGTAGVIPNDNTPCATSSTNQWHACDVWFVSWGVTKAGTNRPFARPLPEIYHKASSLPPYGTDASVWKDVAFYSVNATYNSQHYGPMYFVGMV